MLLALLGLGLAAAMLALIIATRGLNHSNSVTVASVMPLILLLALPTAALLLAGPWLLRLTPTPVAWSIVIATGLLMRVIWFGQPPPLEDDYYRYLWDGALVAHGMDPYRYAPAEFLTGAGVPPSHWALAARALVVLENVNFNDMRTIYPSVAQAAFALGYIIAPLQLDGLRVVLLGGEVATLALLVKLLRAKGAPGMWAALYWLNPLAAAMTVGFAHIDALLPPLVLGALLAAVHGHALLGLVLLGLGAGVKVWPLMLTPMLLWPLRKEPRRFLAAGLMLGVTLLVAMGPVLLSTLKPGSGLTAYMGGWANNNAFYAWTVHGLREGLGLSEGAERALRVALGLATTGVALAQAVRGDPSLASLASRFLIVAAAVFYLSPAQFPWYMVWFLPLAALCGSWPLLLASALLPFYYLFFPHWPLEGGRLFFYGMAFIHSVPVLGWLLLDALRSSKTRFRGNS